MTMTIHRGFSLPAISKLCILCHSDCPPFLYSQCSLHVFKILSPYIIKFSTPFLCSFFYPFIKNPSFIYVKVFYHFINSSIHSNRFLPSLYPSCINSFLVVSVSVSPCVLLKIFHFVSASTLLLYISYLTINSFSLSQSFL